MKTSTIATIEGVTVYTYHFVNGDIEGVISRSKFDAFFTSAQFSRNAVPVSIRGRAYLLSLLGVTDSPVREETLSLECGNILVSIMLNAEQTKSIKFTRVNYD